MVASTVLATHSPAHAVGFTYEVECLEDSWRVTVTVDATEHPTVIEVNAESPYGGLVSDTSPLPLFVTFFDVPKEEETVDFVARAIYSDGAVEAAPFTAVRPDCPFPGTTTTTTLPPPTTAPPPTVPPPTLPPTGGFAFSIRSECRNDTPYVVYDASLDGFAPGTAMVLHWVDANGVERFTQPVSLGSGEVLWPRATVDAAGNPTDWPGWILDANGEWIEGADGFEWARPQVQVYATINPTSPTVTLEYPLATPRCQAQPSEALTQTLLPSTGDIWRQPLVVIGSLLAALGSVLVVIERSRHRRAAAERT